MGFCKEWNLKSIPDGCRCESIDFDLRGPLINFPVVIPPAQELRRLDEPIATRLKNDADTLKFNSLIEFSSSSRMKKFNLHFVLISKNLKSKQEIMNLCCCNKNS